MPLKIVERDGMRFAYIEDDKPVYLDPAGAETTLDAEELQATVARLESSLAAEKIAGAFARSKFIRENVAVPVDLLQSRFGANYKFENGAVVAYDDEGAMMLSTSRPGEPADFEESIAALVNGYPQKDHILKGSGASGTGAKTSAGGAGKIRTMTRADFDRLDAVAKHRTILVDKIQLVD